MVTLTQTATKQYRLYLGVFQPSNWQQKPQRFKIVSRIDPQSFGQSRRSKVPAQHRQ